MAAPSKAFCSRAISPKGTWTSPASAVGAPMSHAPALLELEIGLDQPRAQRVGIGVDSEHTVRGESGDDCGPVIEELLSDHLFVQTAASEGRLRAGRRT